MKRFKLHLVATVIASFFTATSAWSAQPYPFGWYVEGDVGKSVASGKSYPGRVYNSGFGWGLVAGYKFTQYVAGEVGFTHYRESRLKANGATFATDQHFSYDLTGKLMLPVYQTGVDIFGKLGIARINSYMHLNDPGVAAANGYVVNTGVHSHNALYIGAGAEYAILKNLLGNAQWARTKGPNLTGDGDLYSVGLAYIF